MLLIGCPWDTPRWLEMAFGCHWDTIGKQTAMAWWHPNCFPIVLQIVSQRQLSGIPVAFHSHHPSFFQNKVPVASQCHPNAISVASKRHPKGIPGASYFMDMLNNFDIHMKIRHRALAHTAFLNRMPLGVPPFLPSNLSNPSKGTRNLRLAVPRPPTHPRTCNLST